MRTLHAVRYTTEINNPSILEYIATPSNVKIRWSLNGGLQKLEIEVKAKNEFDRLNRYRNHHGQRIAIYDNTIDNAICIGWIYETVLLSNGVRYVCQGAWKRHDALFNDTVYASNTPISDIIEDTLTNFVDVVGSDYSNIDANATVSEGWNTRLRGGDTSQDVIEALLDASDGSNNRYDYWVQPNTVGTRVNPFIPYYKKRDPSSSVDWVVDVSDLASLDLSRNIYNLATDLSVYYGYVSGTATGGTLTTMTDGGANFIADGVQEGDTFYNTFTAEKARVTNVTATVITHSGTPTATGADTYSIRVRNGQNAVNPSPLPSVNFWAVEQVQRNNNLTVTQAQQYADEYADTFSSPVQQQAFIVTAPRIKNGEGVFNPLWNVIKYGGGKIRVNFLDTTVVQFTTSLDDETSFQITALDFDYRSGSLRVALDSFDDRLDVLLKRAGVVAGEVAGIR